MVTDTLGGPAVERRSSAAAQRQLVGASRAHLTPHRPRSAQWGQVRHVVLAALAACLGVLAIAGCGGSSGGTAGGSKRTSRGPLNFVVFETLSGADATFTAQDIAGCEAATSVINSAGGPLGHQIHCSFFNSYDDPADSVPATRAMLSTQSNVIGVLGPQSNVAPPDIPLINGAGYPMWTGTGAAQYDHSTYQFLWRAIPADDVDSVAMAGWAIAKGYKRAAVVFGNDITSQDLVPMLVKAYKGLGGNIVVNQALTLDSPSYQTEVVQLIQARPQVIFTEADPQTSGTYFSELVQMHGLVPVIGTGGTIGYPQWIAAMKHAIGAQNLPKYLQGVQVLAPTGGEAWKLFNSALAKVNASHVSNPSQYNSDPYTETDYDAINEVALAILASHSTSPSTINSWIPRLTSPQPGATVVHTYAAGKTALASGKKIQYVGAGGPQIYNKWHNSEMDFEVAKVMPSGGLTQIAVFPASRIRGIQAQAGL